MNNFTIIAVFGTLWEANQSFKDMLVKLDPGFGVILSRRPSTVLSEMNCNENRCSEKRIIIHEWKTVRHIWVTMRQLCLNVGKGWVNKRKPVVILWLISSPFIFTMNMVSIMVKLLLDRLQIYATTEILQAIIFTGLPKHFLARKTVLSLPWIIGWNSKVRKVQFVYTKACALFKYTDHSCPLVWISHAVRKYAVIVDRILNCQFCKRQELCEKEPNTETRQLLCPTV